MCRRGKGGELYSIAPVMGVRKKSWGGGKRGRFVFSLANRSRRPEWGGAAGKYGKKSVNYCLAGCMVQYFHVRREKGLDYENAVEEGIFRKTVGWTDRVRNRREKEEVPLKKLKD